MKIMPEETSQLHSRRIVSRLRMLTATGLLGVVTTLAVVGFTLWNVRGQRTELSLQQQRLAEMSNQFRRFAAQSHAELESALDGVEATTDLGTASVGFQHSVRAALDTNPDAMVLEPLLELNRLVDRLADLTDRAGDWQDQYQSVNCDLREQRTLTRVRSLITGLRVDAGVALNDQLSELARLVEILAGQEQADSLVQLRDQQINPALTAVARSIAETSDHGAGVSQQSFTDLRAAILGSPVAGATDQTKGGLYNLRRDALELRRSRDILKNESAVLFETIDQANASFAQSAQGRTAELAARMEQLLTNGWRRTLLFGLLCCVAVFWLGWLISGGIYGQIKEIEQARAEAEKGRQTTQKLMLEQQAAAVELEAVHKKLLETSRQAGMAEVATGVLHNVGNVLNSVNVSSTVIAENLRTSPLNHLARIVTLFKSNAADLGNFISASPTGKQIPAFLAQLSEHLTTEQTECLKEVAHLQKNIEHIKDIVSMQQAYACSSGFLEPVDVREMAEDAVNINLAAMSRHDITIIREYAEVPTISADRHKILQIMVNLISNAKHAMKESPVKTMTIKIDAHDGQVRATVRDTGYGIPPENLTKIFAHGFTTKEGGHGFGLHSCANAAKEAGGAMQVHSDGPGRGATFLVSFPIEAKIAIAA